MLFEKDQLDYNIHEADNDQDCEDNFPIHLVIFQLAASKSKEFYSREECEAEYVKAGAYYRYQHRDA